MKEQGDSNFETLKLNPSHFFVIGFISIIFLGATLLNLPFASADERSIGIIDALFTSASAVCVTGLIVVNTAVHWSFFGKFVILMLIQIGGLGIMTMATLIAFLLGKKITLKDRLLIREELNATTLQGIVLLTKRVLIATLLIEMVGAVMLSMVFIKEKGVVQGIWFSVFHSVSAFCNAGFDITGNSLVDYISNPIINISVTTLIIIGGMGFYVIMDIIQKKNFKYYSIHTKIVLVMTIMLLVAGTLVFFAFEYTNDATIGNLSLGDKLMASYFQSVTPRTAGFNTIDNGAMRYSSAFFTILLMFVGGSPGSTAGGIKTTTLGILAITIYRIITGDNEIEVLKKRIPVSLVLRAVAVVGMTFFVIVSSLIILLITEAGSGSGFLDILFETVSAFGTVGLSRGVTPVLSDVGKIVITVTMFIGRIGPLTLAFAIAEKQENKGYFRYPEGKILVG